MAFCPKCGSKVEDGTTFCPNCGSKLGVEKAAPKTDFSEDLKKLGSAPDGDRDLIIDVMNLPEKYRQVVLLVFWQGMTIRETAQCMSTSESTVCRRLEKAKKMIA